MRSPGVFRYLIDEAGFIDKLVVNVWGRRRKRGSTTIASARNLAIGGPGSFYARCIRGYHRISGTPYQLKYGLMRRYTHLSPFVLTMWAGGSPVTCSDAMLLLDGLMRRGYRTVVSSAEVTFDIAKTPHWKLIREICTRSNLFEVVGNDGRTTLYAGKPNSPWQVRIYRKTAEITRIEFVLRSTFLRSIHIHSIQDLLLLKPALLWQHLDFRTVDEYTTVAATKAPSWWLKAGLPWPPILPARLAEHVLRRAGVNPQDYVIPSEIGNTLRRMRRRLIW